MQTYINYEIYIYILLGKWQISGLFIITTISNNYHLLSSSFGLWTMLNK